MPTRDATHSDAHSESERLQHWLHQVDAQVRERTGSPALFAVELETGRRFRGQLARPGPPDRPDHFVGFEPEGDDDETTVYVRLSSIVTVGLPHPPAAGW